MSICCVLSSVERTMQSLVLCGWVQAYYHNLLSNFVLNSNCLRRPVKQPSKQTEMGKHRGKLSVNAPTLKLKADKHQSQNKCSGLRKRLRAPLTLVIPSSITDDSTGDVALRRPVVQCLGVPEEKLDSVDGICPPSKSLLF